jgi:two-component system, OmpR family, sensor histidine kinase MtrB
MRAGRTARHGTKVAEAPAVADGLVAPAAPAESSDDPEPLPGRTHLDQTVDEEGLAPQGDGSEGESGADAEPRPAPGPNRIHLRHRMGLRTRITLLFPALTLVLTSLVSMGVYQVVRTSQLSSRESDARSSTFFNASILQERLGQQNNPNVDVGRVIDALQRPSGGESGLLYAKAKGASEPDWYSSNSAALAQSDLPTALVGAVRDQRHPVIQRFELRGEQPVIAVGVPISSVGASYFELTPLDDLQKTLDNLAVALPGAVALTTIVAFLLGSWVARTALAPLGDVSQAAEAIAADRLDTRLPPSTDPELTGLVTSFNNMAEALQRRIDRDARFASDVSHELRSPLMTLSASVEVLQRRRDELSDRAAAALDLLADDVARFQNLVADLLEISRFDSGAQELEPVPLLVGEFIERALPDIAGHPVDVVAPEDADNLVVEADKRRLVQVMKNLFDNAEKYAGGVSAVTLDQVDGGIEIGVEDEGVGVPPEERELIFERFARGSVAGNRGSDSGTGLGLSLVSEHIHLHGGQVWCETARTNATGARFAFFLPTPTSGLDDSDDADGADEVEGGLDDGSARGGGMDP